jgi:hypothetical protein
MIDNKTSIDKYEIPKIEKIRNLENSLRIENITHQQEKKNNIVLDIINDTSNEQTSE